MRRNMRRRKRMCETVKLDLQFNGECLDIDEGEGRRLTFHELWLHFH